MIGAWKVDKVPINSFVGKTVKLLLQCSEMELLLGRAIVQYRSTLIYQSFEQSLLAS